MRTIAVIVDEDEQLHSRMIKGNRNFLADDRQHQVQRATTREREQATFAVRHDCGPRMPRLTASSRTKTEAKERGTRRLRFAPNQGHGIDEYRAMLEMVISLPSCHPFDFENGGRYFGEYEDRYRVRESGCAEVLDDPPGKSGQPSKGGPSTLTRVLRWLRPW